MDQLIEKLKVLDHNMIDLLLEDQVDSEKILASINEREHILQEILLQAKSVAEFESSLDWQQAIQRTKRIVELAQSETNQLGEQLKKYRHGNKSVRRYQQFL
ncbi:flagellar protein FliT [Vibrio sp. MA40-2]|uniref:flagellar protein FliT n=1 Tax=Vibrio sp. MA40-2 TaxID=3391828 RepID=UPI0039A52ECD